MEWTALSRLPPAKRTIPILDEMRKAANPSSLTRLRQCYEQYALTVVELVNGLPEKRLLQHCDEHFDLDSLEIRFDQDLEVEYDLLISTHCRVSPQSYDGRPFEENDLRRWILMLVAVPAIKVLKRRRNRETALHELRRFRRRIKNFEDQVWKASLFLSESDYLPPLPLMQRVRERLDELEKKTIEAEAYWGRQQTQLGRGREDVRNRVLATLARAILDTAGFQSDSCYAFATHTLSPFLGKIYALGDIRMPKIPNDLARTLRPYLSDLW